VKKITSISKEQIAKFKDWSDEWIKIGLSTEPADFDTATEAALRAYKLCNLDKPMVVLRMGSPMAATLGGAYAWMMLKELGAQVRSQVWSQVESQVGSQVRSQVESQVWSQARSQVESQVRSQVGSQVWSQVESQVWSQVWSQVRSQVGNQVWSQVRSQVGSQVWSQVESQVGSQVRSQVESQVWSQVRSQVGNQVGSQVRSQVESQVWSQVRSQVRSQVWSQVGSGANNYRGGQLWLAGWCAYVSFFRDQMGWENETLERFEIDEALCKSCGWVWWHENVLAISDRPSELHRDQQGRLHSEKGPSIAYRDGWSLYHWHGVAIPPEWVTGKPPSASEALTWANIEQRRAACEIVGWTKILKELDARVIDEDSDPEIGTLLEVDLPDSGRERFLKVRCATGREFAIIVTQSKAKTALEAQQWMFPIPKSLGKFIKPQLTA